MPVQKNPYWFDVFRMMIGDTDTFSPEFDPLTTMPRERLATKDDEWLRMAAEYGRAPHENAKFKENLDTRRALGESYGLSYEEMEKQEREAAAVAEKYNEIHDLNPQLDPYQIIEILMTNDLSGQGYRNFFPDVARFMGHG